MAIFRKVISVAFALTSVVFCFIFLRSIVYRLADISAGPGGAYAISGADRSALKRHWLPALFMLLQAAAMLSFSVFNLLSAFKNKLGAKTRWRLAALLLATVLLFVLLPPQSYVVGMYATFRSFLGWNLLFLAELFYWLGIAIAVLAGISLIPFHYKGKSS